MSLEQCRDCGHSISSKAFACPKCGRLIRARSWWAVTIGWGVIMSAVISFLLGLLLMLAFVTLIGGLGALGSYSDRETPVPVATPPR
jgi:uncharacterized OB-fold protein